MMANFLSNKQRVNRVTQKRHIILPYSQAIEFCDHRQRIDLSNIGADKHADGQKFVDEVFNLITHPDLRAAAMTGYLREP